MRSRSWTTDGLHCPFIRYWAVNFMFRCLREQFRRNFQILRSPLLFFHFFHRLCKISANTREANCISMTKLFLWLLFITELLFRNPHILKPYFGSYWSSRGFYFVFSSWAINVKISVFLAHAPYSNVLPSFDIFKNSFAMSPTTLKVSEVHFPVGPVEFAFSAHASVVPIAFIFISSTPYEYALPVSFAFIELSLVVMSIKIAHFSEPMTFVVLKLSGIVILIGAKISISMKLQLFHLSLV